MDQQLTPDQLIRLPPGFELLPTGPANYRPTTTEDSVMNGNGRLFGDFDMEGDPRGSLDSAEMEALTLVAADLSAETTGELGVPGRQWRRVED